MSESANNKPTIGASASPSVHLPTKREPPRSSMHSTRKSKESRTDPLLDSQENIPMNHLPPSMTNNIPTNTEIHLERNYNDESRVSSLDSPRHTKNMETKACGQNNTAPPPRFFINGIYMSATDNEGKIIFVPEDNVSGIAIDAAPQTIDALKRLLMVFEQKINNTSDSAEGIKRDMDNIQLEIYKNTMRVDNLNRHLSERMERVDQQLLEISKSLKLILHKNTDESSDTPQI